MIFLIIGIIFACLIFLKYHYTYWQRKGIPGPRPIFLVGNIGRSLIVKKGLAFILQEIYEQYEDCDYVGFYNGFTRSILIRNPEMCKNILIRDFNKFHDNFTHTEISVDPILGRNPFVTRGDKWKSARNRITTQLTPGKVKLMMPLTNQVCKDMVTYLKSDPDLQKQGINVKILALKFTIDNVVNCSFGLEVKSFQNKETIFSKFYEAVSVPGSKSFLKHIIGMHFPKLAHYLDFTFVGEKIPQAFYEIVDSTIKYREKNNVIRNDYLDALRADKSPGYTKDGIIADVGTFFQDGTETSSLLLSSTLYELAVNPLVQQKARAEVESIVANYEGKITFPGLQEMNYLHNIVLEGLRIHPPIFLMSRICTEKCTIPAPKKGGKDVIIEKGTPLFIPINAIQSDPAYFPNPERFDPDRFTPENENGRPKCCLLGFGEGPRICIGKNFGIYQQKAALATLLLEFEIRLSDKMTTPLQSDVRQIVFNNPINAIWLRFIEREKN